MSLDNGTYREGCHKMWSLFRCPNCEDSYNIGTREGTLPICICRVIHSCTVQVACNLGCFLGLGTIPSKTPSNVLIALEGLGRV